MRAEIRCYEERLWTFIPTQELNEAAGILEQTVNSGHRTLISSRPPDLALRGLGNSFKFTGVARRSEIVASRGDFFHYSAYRFGRGIPLLH
jgi:hypothetical protein